MTKMIVTVHQVDKSSDLSRFLELSALVYKNDSNYCAETEDRVLRSVFRNDFEGKQRILIAEVGSVPMARLVARVSPLLKDDSGKPFGMLGFFEAANNPPVVKTLFNAAIDWLKGAGASQIIGPMDGDTWHKYRLNVGPFERPPFLMEPYNPPYYEELWTMHGFVPLENYYSKVVTDLPLVREKTKKFSERSAARGYRLRRIDIDRLAEELGIIYELSRQIFSRNYLYTPIQREEFLALYDGIGPLLNPELIWFAQSPEGREIGYVFAFVDNFRAVAAMGGKRRLLSKLRFAMKMDRTDTVNIKTLGVIPKYQRTGIAIALMHQIYSKIEEKGFRQANLCLIKEGNPSGRMDGNAGEILRHYRLYGLQR